MYQEGFLIYYESCSLEPIGNSITRYVAMNLLKSQQVLDSETDLNVKVAYHIGEC